MLCMFAKASSFRHFLLHPLKIVVVKEQLIKSKICVSLELDVYSSLQCYIACVPKISYCTQKTVTSHIKMRLVFSFFAPSREGL